MFKSILVTGIAGLFLLSGPAQPAQPTDGASLDLEPAINGAVSANGLFPSQVMEEAFAAYLRWTKDRGISRLIVFEPRIDATAVEASLPNERMATQFEAYMRWVDEQGLSPFYAFKVTDFD
jgi:hypothetical protein